MALEQKKNTQIVVFNHNVTWCQCFMFEYLSPRRHCRFLHILSLFLAKLDKKKNSLTI